MGHKYNILLSYPRSGNSWVRYIVEYISKKPTTHTAVKCPLSSDKNRNTIGNLVDIDTNLHDDPILFKRHRADLKFDNWTPNNSSLILIIRSYKECLLRNLSIKNINDENRLGVAIERYLHCISFYDSFKGKKLLIYYEDLISCPKLEIDKILSFLNIEKNKYYDDFFKNFSTHKARSIKDYAGGSQTYGDKRKLQYHERRFGTKFSNKIEERIKKSKVLFDKYLRKKYSQ